MAPFYSFSIKVKLRIRYNCRYKRPLEDIAKELDLQRGTQSNESPTLVSRDAGWGLKSRRNVGYEKLRYERYEGEMRDKNRKA